jgi:hypothetical protein
VAEKDKEILFKMSAVMVEAVCMIPRDIRIHGNRQVGAWRPGEESLFAQHGMQRHQCLNGALSECNRFLGDLFVCDVPAEMAKADSRAQPWLAIFEEAPMTRGDVSTNENLCRFTAGFEPLAKRPQAAGAIGLEPGLR